jgi:hypothetical protein
MTSTKTNDATTYRYISSTGHNSRTRNGNPKYAIAILVAVKVMAS